MHKRVSIVGVGMNGFETMTKSAIEAVQKSDVLIGARRMTGLFDELGKPVVISYHPYEIAEFILKCEYENISVLMSGDCGFYSGTQGLIAALGDMECTVYSGISSPVYFCSKLKIPWSDLRFVSLHGRKANIVRLVSSNEKTFFLLGGNYSAADVCRKLCEYGLCGVKVYIGENLNCENERILIGSAEDFKDIETGTLCVMIAENGNFEKGLRSCIPDREFIRGDVPMTKSEVRCAAVSMLEIGSGDVCWDIGSGTGSVSVEMAFRCSDGTVYAVDKNEKAINLTDENRHKFRCDNIETIYDNAENAVENLPAPDCVFVGGSGSSLEKIISAAFGKNPGVKIVITAVSLETLSDSIDILKKYEAETEITQIAVTHTRKIGNHTMMNAENPIFIIRGAMK